MTWVLIVLLQNGIVLEIDQPGTSEAACVSVGEQVLDEDAAAFRCVERADA